MELKKVWKRVMLGATVAILAVALGVGVSLAAPTYSITGKVTHAFADNSKFLTSNIYAEVFTRTYDDAAAAWVWTSTGTTTTVSPIDGTYAISGLAPGNYRVGFGDLKNQFDNVFYLNAATAAAAQTITIDQANVALSDQAVSATLLPAAIGGTLDLSASPDKADASISAVVYAQRYVWVQSTKAWTLSWTPIGSSQVATDGTYSVLDLPTTTTGVWEKTDDNPLVPNTSIVTTGTYASDYNVYKVAFVDANNVFSTLYNGGTSLSNAATMSLSPNQQVTVNGTMSLLTGARKFSGKVNFVGAQQVSGDVYATVYSVDASGTWTVVANTVPVSDGGTWAMHFVPTAVPTNYRIAFNDSAAVFGDAVYGSTPTATIDVDATDVTVASDTTSAAGINATMTAQVSVTTAGSDAIDTAVQVAQSQYATATTVVLCSADSWTYSVAAAPYAKLMNAPILLTHKNNLPDATLTEIGVLDPTEVVIIGGPSAVSFDVEAQLRANGVTVVRRLEGADAPSTSAAVAQELLSRGLLTTGDDGKLSGIVVVGTTTPYEAMCAAPVAADQAMPVLLVKKNSISNAVQDILDNYVSAETNVLVVGGTNNVSDEVATQLTPVSSDNEEAFNAVFSRVAVDKNDRYAMSVALAQYAIDNFNFSSRKVMLTTNLDSAEALAYGPTIATKKEPLLITASALKKAYVKGTSAPRLYTYLATPVEEYLTKTSVTDETGAITFPLDPDGAFTHNPNVAVIDTIGQMDSKVLSRALSFLNY